MFLLEPSEVVSIRHFFDTPIQRLVGESVIAGHTKGTAWVDERDTPRLAVMQSGASV